MNTENNIKLIVAGGRNFLDKELMWNKLNKILEEENISEIVSGGALGADILGERWAKENNIPIVQFKPQYNGPNDRFAPLRRNTQMAEYGDKLIAFWDGKSKGTFHMIKQMEKYQKEVIIIAY